MNKVHHQFKIKIAGTVLPAALLLAAVLMAGCLPSSPAPVASLPTLQEVSKPVLPASDRSGITPSDELLVSIYDQINPGVVAILVYTQGLPVGQGSGFVIDTQGHILTNYHVVENLVDFEVIFSDGYRAVGELVGTDPDSDIAVIKVNVPEAQLAPLALGSSANVRVGQTVIAIGNPYGLSGTMTVGIVSARGRLLESMRPVDSAINFSAADLIQTDANINPGNSGGPLINLQGEVIGINRAIRTDGDSGGTISNTGIGFAVPIDIVRRVAPHLIRDGSYDYPYLGITSREEFTLAQLTAIGQPPDMRGAYVVSVSPSSPAEKAGLQGGNRASGIEGLPAGGDLIKEVNGYTIRNFSDFLNYLVTNTSPGDAVQLKIDRGGSLLQLTATLIARPQ